MILKNLNIVKFRSLENKKFNFEKNNSIYVFDAKNGVGKTTILDTILWILADETLVYGADNTKNLDVNKPDDELCVEATFLKDDNETELVLKRCYKPSYTKGGEFSSYANDFYINGAKYQVKEYKARINQEIGLKEDVATKGFNTMRAIIDFDYLGNLDYKITREKIEKILNISSDTELLKDEKFKPIVDDLKAQLFDIAKIKTRINKEIKDSKAYIDMQQPLLDQMEKSIKPFDEKAYNDLIAELEALEKTEYKPSQEYLDFIAKQKELDTSIKALLENYNNNKYNYELLFNQNTNINNQINQKKELIENIKKQFNALKSTEQKCPACGHSLNGAVLKEQLLKLKADYEQAGKELLELKEQAISLEELEVAEKCMVESKKEYDSAQKELTTMNNSCSEMLLKENNNNLQFNQLKFEKMADIKNQMAIMKTNADTSAIEPLKKKIDDVLKLISTDELKLLLLDDFKKLKIEYLEKKVESVFPGIKFVLIEESNTGTITQTCKATYNNVDYLGLNVARQILLGFEIIEDLRKALGITETLPLVFDKLHDLDNANILKLKDITKSQIFTTRSGKTDDIEIKII